MKFTELSVDDQELIRVFIEMAREECGVLGWSEVEPVLAACWKRIHRRSSELRWHDISAHVRNACYGDDQPADALPPRP